MTPNKEWMSLFDDRFNEKYEIGVQSFLNYAFGKAGTDDTICCPCMECLNTTNQSREVVELHLNKHGMMQNYTTWYYHGEKPKSSSNDENLDENDENLDENDDEEIPDLLSDLYPGFNGSESDENNQSEEPNTEAKTFYKLMKESEQPTYPGCETSKLDVLVNLLHRLLLKRVLPNGSTLPESYYEAKKTIKDLGLSYEKIDSCKNDCMLYWKEKKEFDVCEVCGVSRWKNDIRSGENKVGAAGKKLAVKILRYFPLKPRLQRLFMSSKTASFMRWHHEKRANDGVMRHPGDSKAWKSFDDLHKDFSAESRNVRLGLASDGFQPFTHSKSSYSIWPVILIPYNLPPWMCMKESNFILSMLIPGPDSPGDTIDVYLRPLIDELNELWETGIETFDVSTHQNFKLRASLLWTINDFPAYANLSGWSTKGKMACPCCTTNTCSMRLPNSKKQCYMGHRRYLPVDHKWRNNKTLFDGNREVRLPPSSLSGSDVLSQVNDLEGIILTKDAKIKSKVSHEKRGDNWNKKSIFFELPYWKSLLLRHNLDVMHIEKNICENILGTIMNMKGKTKDTVQSRLDLEVMGIRSDLHPIRKGDKYELPVASYTLSTKEKHLFCLFFKQLRVSDGFSSNISQSVNMKEHKISGLKSHDFHVLLQYLLPLGIRDLLPKIVYEPLVEICLFFASLGSKTLKMDELENIESQIPYTLCKLEQIFPPSFFDVMVHLSVHLANEAKIGGPVQYRWMYPIERMLFQLKRLIRNTARPEGSIAEGYIAKECMTLCSRYLKDTRTKFNRVDRNYNDTLDRFPNQLSVFSHYGQELGAGVTRLLSDDEWEKAHVYILKNCDEIQSFVEEYSQFHPNKNTELWDDNWNVKFLPWFKKRVEKMTVPNSSSDLNDMLALSRGPTKYVTSFNGYVVNGYRFRIEDRDSGSRTQNSGVCVLGDISNENDHINYYGVLTEVLELKYLHNNSVVLFKCKWFDVFDKNRGVKLDEYGFTSINSHRFLKTNEPFVLASQVSQVFYVIDNINKGWFVVVRTQPRDLYEMQTLDEDESNDIHVSETYQHDESFTFNSSVSTSSNTADQNIWRRTDLEPIMEDLPTSKRKRKRKSV